jgi:hypothetical protein
MMLLEKRINRCSKGNFLFAWFSVSASRTEGNSTYRKFRTNIRNKLQVNAAILDTKKLVNHGLVCPWTKKWGDRVVPAI